MTDKFQIANDIADSLGSPFPIWSHTLGTNLIVIEIDGKKFDVTVEERIE